MACQNGLPPRGCTILGLSESKSNTRAPRIDVSQALQDLERQRKQKGFNFDGSAEVQENERNGEGRIKQRKAWAQRSMEETARRVCHGGAESVEEV